MKEVVKKEILKLLDNEIIFFISNSLWISPIQVVPKKSGITVVQNKANKLVLTKVQIGYRVCIDYKKLNAATSKDHFLLPFIDQMLEVSRTRVLLFFRWIFWLQPDFYSIRGLREDRIYQFI